MNSVVVDSPSKAPRLKDSVNDRNSSLRILAPEEFADWDALVEASNQGSVFCRTWWLRATCGTPKILGLLEGGRLVAGMPLYFVRRFGLRFCTMPKLTLAWGVVMDQCTGKETSAASHEMRLLRPFADYVSRFRLFDQKFHHTVQNWLPFHWKGFVATPRISQSIEDITQSSAVWNGMSSTARREVRKAEKNGLFVVQSGADDLWDVEVKTFAHQRERVSYTKEYLAGIVQAATMNDQGRCFSVRDSSGRLHAAGFVVWDHRRGYYLVRGSDHELRASAASSLLAWHILQYAGCRTRALDFGGSMLEGVERFNRNFGTRRTTYHWVMKFPLSIYIFLKDKWPAYAWQ